MRKLNFAYFSVTVASMFLGSSLFAQTSGQESGIVKLDDLSFFKNPSKSWKIAGDVHADLNQVNALDLSKGTGILVNQPDKRNHGEDLYTNLEHGDLDLELDYMMAKGANSGIYLQGRYELQLEDSWGAKTPTSANNGGIYERWDESRPEGHKGYEGYAPRQNASKAPGLWQHLKISFQAPRFDESGKKIENAKIISAVLNGVPIHENLQLQGPTRGAVSNDEAAFGPLRLQGDHGAVAFRNIKIVNFDKPRPQLIDLKYKVYKGRFQKETDFSNTPPEVEGATATLSSDLSTLPNDFLIDYRGTLRVKAPGEYTFNLNANGGVGVIKINNKVVKPWEGNNGKVSVKLEAGDFPFELLYSKYVEWERPSVGLLLSGPGIREYLIGEEDINDLTDPILIKAPVNTVLRSFMDLPKIGRVVHAVSVGSPEYVHYTYDMDKGAIIQVWRGEFLDATPMWHDRGDGSSRPRGAVQRFGKPALTVNKLSATGTNWTADTTGSGYRPKGYVMDAQDRPAFRYEIYGTAVTDAIQVLNEGQGIKREITVQNAPADLYVRLAEGNSIEELSNGRYLVDDKSYYLQLDDAAGAKPVLRDMNGRKELIIPVKAKLTYSLLF
ncbi:family 16 glycoside hydrolase [Rubrolithibacter danxiaensis]|uniref:family 16 glycoside hydrolase n=1 Tax=Rubrolithibacter danxiaensis TaxID=3390805 RepID=UPI003BF7DBD1